MDAKTSQTNYGFTFAGMVTLILAEKSVNLVIKVAILAIRIPSNLCKLKIEFRSQRTKKATLIGWITDLCFPVVVALKLWSTKLIELEAKPFDFMHPVPSNCSFFLLVCLSISNSCIYDYRINVMNDTLCLKIAERISLKC